MVVVDVEPPVLPAVGAHAALQGQDCFVLLDCQPVPLDSPAGVRGPWCGTVTILASIAQPVRAGSIAMKLSGRLQVAALRAPFHGANMAGECLPLSSPPSGEIG